MGKTIPNSMSTYSVVRTVHDSVYLLAHLDYEHD